MFSYQLWFQFFFLLFLSKISNLPWGFQKMIWKRIFFHKKYSEKISFFHFEFHFFSSRLPSFGSRIPIILSKPNHPWKKNKIPKKSKKVNFRTQFFSFQKQDSFKFHYSKFKIWKIRFYWNFLHNLNENDSFNSRKRLVFSPLFQKSWFSFKLPRDYEIFGCLLFWIQKGTPLEKIVFFS